jgi:hypothetical protein
MKESPPGGMGLWWALLAGDRQAIGRAALIFGGIVAALLVGSFALDAPMAPWLRSFGLWPTLTGGWHGHVEAAGGPVTTIYLELDGVVRRRDSHIGGTAKWCDEQGQVHAYTISGQPRNWRGSRFYLSLRSVVERESGASPGELEGEWHDDEIRAAGVMVSHSRVATATATRSSGPAGPPQIIYRLRRGTEREFLASCTASRKNAP